jgi:hypothetical protein
MFTSIRDVQDLDMHSHYTVIFHNIASKRDRFIQIIPYKISLIQPLLPPVNYRHLNNINYNTELVSKY